MRVPKVLNGHKRVSVSVRSSKSRSKMGTIKEEIFKRVG